MRTMTTAQYDHGWESQWDDMKKYGPFARHLRRMIMNLIRPLGFESIVDVGCGQGALLMEVATAFPLAKVFGTEVSPAALEMAKGRIPQGQFWPLDLEQACLPQQFDLVICSEVLEHIPNDVVAIQHLAAMTGKYLIVSSPQGRMRSREPAAWGHVRNYGHRELVTKLERAGLRAIRVIEWGFPFYSPIYRDLMNLTDGKGTAGKYGAGQKLIAQAIYVLFNLNSTRRGDELVVLAQPNISDAE